MRWGWGRRRFDEGLTGEIDQADLLVPGHGVGGAGVDAVLGLGDGDAIEVDLDGGGVLGKKQFDRRLNLRLGLSRADDRDGSVVIGLTCTPRSAQN